MLNRRFVDFNHDYSNMFIIANAPIADTERTHKIYKLEHLSYKKPNGVAVRDICSLDDLANGNNYLVFQGLDIFYPNFKVIEKKKMHRCKYSKIIKFLIKAGGLRHELNEYYDISDRNDDDKFIIDMCRYFATNYLVELNDCEEIATKKIDKFIRLVESILRL